MNSTVDIKKLWDHTNLSPEVKMQLDSNEKVLAADVASLDMDIHVDGVDRYADIRGVLLDNPSFADIKFGEGERGGDR